MGRRRTEMLLARAAERTEPQGTVHDSRWPGQARFAVGRAALILVLLLAVDLAAGELNPARAVIWTGISALLFVVLIPARVSVGPGRLISRGLLHERWVSTDRLALLRWSSGVAERVVLRDTDGRRVEIDPHVLLATPQLWHQLERDAQFSLSNGTLRHGAGALRALTQRLDGETVRLVFQRSELD